MLDGARLEKIHAPRPNVLAFTFFAEGQKRHVIFRFDRQNPLLFLSDQRLDNPARPPAAVMRLRKYFGGKRLGRAVIDYAARALAFPVLATPEAEPCWLLLDMAGGAFVLKEFPAGFGTAPRWPDMALVDSLDSAWLEYPLLTPLLRETLAALAPLDGRALLVDLEAGGGDLFLYADASGRPVLYTAWPLPEALCERRFLVPYPEEKMHSLACEAYPALALVAETDGPKFFAELGKAVRKEASAPRRQAKKKRDRLLAKLDQEEKRLSGMAAQRADAVALQGILWRYPAESKLESVSVSSENGTLGRSIALNSLLTVRENMVRMFKESARGARGLAMLELRRAQLGSAPVCCDTSSGIKPKHHRLPETAQNEFVAKNVTHFRSSDGFTLLRGKNAKGNQSLLKIGKGHDLWLHVEDGPSAHLIIRRSHAAEEVPEQTLREAAILVGEKSWQRHDGKARIMVALLRHVHAIKGAPPGTVRVDAVLQTIVVSLGMGASPQTPAGE